MKLNKKYTMEEFEEMFNKAQREAIDKLEKDWEMLTKDFNRNCTLFVNKINEIIDKLNEIERDKE